jgi:hypothetical protein
MDNTELDLRYYETAGLHLLLSNFDKTQMLPQTAKSAAAEMYILDKISKFVSKANTPKDCGQIAQNMERKFPNFCLSPKTTTIRRELIEKLKILIEVSDYGNYLKRVIPLSYGIPLDSSVLDR